MIEKIKEKINKSKNDKENFVGYIKSFCENEKAKELYKNNEEFVNLEEFLEEKKDNE